MKVHLYRDDHRSCLRRDEVDSAEAPIVAVLDQDSLLKDAIENVGDIGLIAHSGLERPHACLAQGGKLDGNVCGSAKIAVEIGKDGRVVRAEVAQSTLPESVTNCVKARLAAVTYACPAEGRASPSVLRIT